MFINFLSVSIFFIFSTAYGFQTSNFQADSLLESYRINKKFSGVAVVFDASGVLYQKTIGTRTAGSEEKIVFDDIFRIGSLTKEFTAYLILNAAQRNELSLDSKVGEFLPATGQLAETKLRLILNHSAGLSNQTVYNNYLNEPCTSVKKDKLSDWLKTISIDELKVGHFSYSNAGYNLLGCILEKKTKQQLNKLLESRIFKPLKMDSSGVAWSFPSSNRLVKAKSKNDLDVEFDTSSYFGAGDIVSNVPDMIKWQNHLKESKLYNAMVNEAIKGKDNWSYGFGVIVDSFNGEPFYWTSGNTPGFVSELAWLPKKSMGVIILTNRQDFQVRAKASTPMTVELLNIFLGIKSKPADVLKSIGL